MLTNLINREDPDHIGTKLGGQLRTDAFGTTYILCYAAAAALINTPYALIHGAYGATVNGIASSAVDAKVVVAHAAVATGSYGWFAMRGLHDVVITTSATATDGDAIKIHTLGVPISDATPNIADFEPDTWAVALEAKGAGTAVTIKCFIMDREIVYAAT